MSKGIRQYIGLLVAIIAYYLIHEGSHLVYALLTGVFKQINFMGMGVQVDIYAEQLSQSQLGVFCLLGSLATLLFAYLFVVFTEKIVTSSSMIFKACMYYITSIMLILDPLYLSVLCGFFGGGDMNGISLLMPEILARILYGLILLINFVLFSKVVFPKYKKAFE